MDQDLEQYLEAVRQVADQYNRPKWFKGADQLEKLIVNLTDNEFLPERLPRLRRQEYPLQRYKGALTEELAKMINQLAGKWMEEDTGIFELERSLLHSYYLDETPMEWREVVEQLNPTQKQTVQNTFTATRMGGLETVGDIRGKTFEQLKAIEGISDKRACFLKTAFEAEAVK